MLRVKNIENDYGFFGIGILNNTDEINIGTLWYWRFINRGKHNFMDWKIFLTIFASVFIAELGDKTQLATMLFAADKEISKYTVFIAASAALIVASAIGVLAGSLLTEYINEKYLHYKPDLVSSLSALLRCTMLNKAIYVGKIDLSLVVAKSLFQITE